MLFQSERGGLPVLDVWQQVRADLADNGEDGDEDDFGESVDADTLAFADVLVKAYAENRDEVERELEELVVGWTFGQMAQTDLNVLRLAVAEMRFGPPLAPEISIESAVRLAKRFGGEVSGRFVNGVLAKLYRRMVPSADEEG